MPDQDRPPQGRRTIPVRGRARAPAHRSDTRPRGWLLLAIVLTLASATCGAIAWERMDPAVAAPMAPSAADGDLAPPDSRPTALSIAAIDVSTPLVGLGLQEDRTVEVPADPDRAGWYRLGPVPGSPGSAVVLGHVDSVDGPAVFARLRTLERGAAIVVAHADGSTSRFLVRGIATYANADFPAARVYRNHGTPTLTLVTCGGAYDAAKGGYQANVVVTAGYVGGTEPAPG